KPAAAAGGNILFYNDGASSVTGSTSAATGNNFSNVTVPGATIILGWNNQDGLSAASGPAKSFTGNTFNNIVGGTGAVTVVNFDFGGNTTDISTNSITNV